MIKFIAFNTLFEKIKFFLGSVRTLDKKKVKQAIQIWVITNQNSDLTGCAKISKKIKNGVRCASDKTVTCNAYVYLQFLLTDVNSYWSGASIQKSYFGWPSSIIKEHVKKTNQNLVKIVDFFNFLSFCSINDILHFIYRGYLYPMSWPVLFAYHEVLTRLRLVTLQWTTFSFCDLTGPDAFKINFSTVGANCCYSRFDVAR